MKILYVTTISLTINSFFKPHIAMLVREGHQVELACNAQDLPLDPLYHELGCRMHQIDFSRSPLSADNIKAYGQLKKVIEAGQYDIVHCHTPNAAVITRLVCRSFRKKTGLKVFYTAHGFHFYKGAPKLNWMLYYPVEKFCSRFTDKLVTINREDYALAGDHFTSKEVCYVPGVGIDLSKFEQVQVDRDTKRQSLGIPADAVVLMSVGELNAGKNHKVILEAMAKVHCTQVHYVIAGKGDLLQMLQDDAEELGIADRVHFLGYRKDIIELYKMADICCFPSFREGLPVSLMEAMACGLPVVCSKIRGNMDLVAPDAGFLVAPTDADGFASAIEKYVENPELRSVHGARNRAAVRNFSTEVVLEKVRQLYEQS